MKKLVLLMFLLIGTTLKVSAITSTQSYEEDSYECRKKAYEIANASGYEYGSEDWQWVYYSEKQMCETEEQ